MSHARTSRFTRDLVLALCLASVSGCGDQRWLFDDAAKDDGGGFEEADAAAATCSPPCAVAQVCDRGTCQDHCGEGAFACDGVCYDLDTDAKRCGSCGAVCRAGENCQAGTCTCPPSRTVCGDVCVSLMNDDAHCGACNVQCAEGLACRSGGCR